MNQELFEAVKVLISFFIGALFVYLFSLWVKKNKKSLDVFNFVIDIATNFINSNPNLVEKPWNSVKKQIDKFFATYLKVDLTDEQWNEIWKIIYDEYIQARKKIEEETKSE